jgi:hypothetical protein
MDGREILEAVIASIEHLVESVEKMQTNLSEHAKSIGESVDSIVDIISHGEPNGLTDEEVNAAFDRWLDAHCSEFTRRYGADWRAKLEKSARKAYGDRWKRALLRNPRQRKQPE